MKLLFVNDNLTAGGKERRLIELLYYLKHNTNYDLHLVLIDEEIHYSYVFELGIPIVFFKRRILRKDPMIFFRFYSFIRNLKPDIIHVWGGMSCLYAIPAAILRKIPLINNQIADVMPKKTWLDFAFIIWQVNKFFSNLLIANSYAGLKAYKVKSHKGKVIYNGVRLERFQGLADSVMIRQKYGIRTTFCVVMVANFSQYKDHLTFIAVARLINRIRDDVTFIAVGDGPNRNSIMKNVKEKGPGNMVFVGKIERVEELVNACDIGVLFTFGEGISNAILEYMALGKPVIATDAGGTCELISPYKSGYLVNNNSIEDIVQKIIKLLNKPELRKEMGTEGRNIVKERFSLSLMGMAYIDTYHSCIEKYRILENQLNKNS